MSRQFRLTSHANVTSGGPGESTLTKGTDNIGFYVAVTASGVSTATNLEFACQVEGSAVDKDYAPIGYRAPQQDNVLEVTEDDLYASSDSANTFVAMVVSNSFAVEYVRANIITFGEQIDRVLTQLFLGGSNTPARKYGRTEELNVEQPYDVVD